MFPRVLVLCAILLITGTRLCATLPEPWSDTDIGTVGSAGGVSYDSDTGTYTIQGSGTDIGSTADSFHFTYRPLSGDGYIIARIASLTNTHSAAKAGVMIRETLAANSKYALMMVTPGSGVGIKWRSSTAGASSQVLVGGIQAPHWVKLERRGSLVTGYESADGITWNVVQRVAVSMAANVYVGLSACSRTSGLTTVVADQVTVDAPEAGVALPWPWVEDTVGTPADAGVALYDGNYVLSNLGAGITGMADKMKYVSQTLTGDGTLTVKVDSVTSADTYTRLGLMMRETFDANSRCVLLGLTTGKSVLFMSRRTIGGTLTSCATSVTMDVPAWFRLERNGNVFTAWRSVDGVNWTVHGSETLDLGPTLQVGLAYSNHSTSTWAIGVGDELRLTSPLDTDGNGLDDMWELQYFGGIGVDPLADPDGDGLTNNQEWDLGNDPLVFNLEGQRPVLELVGGDNQTGIAGTVLPQSLVVRVKDSLSGAPLADIPVLFRVTQGAGLLGATLQSSSSLRLLSDSNGLVQSSFALPLTAGTNVVGASVGGRQQASVVTFGLKALVGEGSVLLDRADIGTVALPGQVQYQDGTYTLTGATVVNNSGTSDNSTFAWMNFTGDGCLVVRANFVDATDPYAQAGVMIRENLEGTSRNVAMLLTPGNGVAFQWRDTINGSTGVTRTSGVSGPVWLLLRRSGNTFTGFYSADGQTWQIGGARTLALGATLKVGLTLGTKTTVYNRATFDNLRLTQLSEVPWRAADIGSPQATAIDDYAGDSIFVRAGGTDITGESDAFHYIYQPLTSYGRLVARVGTQLATATNAKSSLMIRESLATGSRHVTLMLTPASGVTLRARSQTGGTTTTLGNIPAVAPYWLKLERFGSRIDAFASPDGEAWTLVGSTIFDPGATPLIGLAAASNNPTAHTQTRFDNLQLEMGGGALGWNGTYYEGTAFEGFRAYRRDAAIDFSWHATEPPAPGVPAQGYSVRWEGDVVPTYSETYTFTELSQGNARVTVNGQVIIDRWNAHTLSEAAASVTLQAGQAVRVIVEYANASGDGRIQLRWSSASQPDAPVPFTSVQAIDADDDRISDAWEIAHGLDPFDPTDGLADPDHDGVPNVKEYQLGLDPHHADENVPGVTVMEQWNSITGWMVSSLTNSSRYPAQPSAVSLLGTLAVSADSGDNYGRRIRGLLLPPVTGDYTFWVSGNRQVQLWLSPTESPFDRVLVASVYASTVTPRSYDVSSSQRSQVVRLEAGRRYYIEVFHKAVPGSDHFSVAWRIPGAQRETIAAEYIAAFASRPDDLDDDGLPDAWESAHGIDPAKGYGLDGAYGDRDADGLTNLEEYQRGTNPCLADTDGDGVNDYDAIYLAEVDPTVGAFGGPAQTVVSLAGATGTAVQGTWLATETGSIEARSLRGSVSYNASVADGGIYRLDLTVMDVYAGNPSRTFELGLKIDGIAVGTLFIEASGAASGVGRLYLPWLSAGSHVIEIDWENGRPDSFLRIVSFTLVNPGNGDADGDGIADWVASRLAHTFVMDGARVETHVSPFTVEGASAYPQFVTATATYSPSSAGDPLTLTVNEGLTRHWFAHVPLFAGAATTVTAAEAGGLITQEKEIVWTPLNLLDLEDGAQQLVREGDHLLVSAHVPELAAMESVVVTRVAPDGQFELHTLATGETLELSFDEAGDYELWVTLPGGAPSLALTVQARRVQLAPAPLVIGLAARVWLPAGLPAEAVIEADPSLSLAETFPATSPRKFSLAASSGVQRLVARLGTDGPIADVLAIEPLRSYHAEKGRWDVVQVFDDGTELWKGVIDLGGPVPPTIRITITGLTAGTMFDDGTRTRTLTAADFDENGNAVYYMLRSPDSLGAPCHDVKFYDGTTYLNYSY